MTDAKFEVDCIPDDKYEFIIKSVNQNMNGHVEVTERGTIVQVATVSYKCHR